VLRDAQNSDDLGRRGSAGPLASRRCAAAAAHGPGAVERMGIATQVEL